MQSFKELDEASRFVASSDFKVSASGRKVHKMKKVADAPKDMDGDGDIDADDKEIARKYSKESVELEEAADKEEQRMLQLARLGLVDKADVSKLRIALGQFKADKPLTIQQRTMLLGVMQDLISVITGDDMIFNRVKQDVREGTNEDPPFTPDPPKKNPVAKAGKHGQGYSTARHLARMALKKFQDKKQSSKQDK